MSVINYAVVIITEKTQFTNTAYGLVDGAFRYITGSPDYDGTPAKWAKWEDGTDNNAVWYEGWLLKDRMSNPTREVDLSQTGDYGTFNGFEFSIRNDLLLWVYIRDNAIYFTNREMRLYCVIDGVFHLIFSGVVSNNPYDEIDYRFVCTTPFKKIHKPFPPLIINPDSFEGASSKATNEPMQVVIGDCTYVKLQVITDEPVLSTLADSGLIHGSRHLAKSCGCVHYAVTGLDKPTLTLYNKSITFAEDELVGKYIYVASGGGDPDTDQLILITSNTATATSKTTIEIDAPFDYTSETLFNQKYAYDPLRGTLYPYIMGNDATELYRCQKQAAVYGGISVLGNNTWVKFSALDFSNYGIGCNVVKLVVMFDLAIMLTIRTGSTTGPIIGEYPITATYPTFTEIAVGIQKQYSSSQDLYLMFDRSGVENYNGILNKIRVSHNPSDIDTWWFSIVEMPSSHIISTGAIQEIVKDPSTGLPYVYIHNEKTDAMDPAPYVVLDQLTSIWGDLNHPQFTMYTSKMTKSGDIRYMTPVVPTSWELRTPENGYMPNQGSNVKVLSNAIKAQSGFDLCDRSQAIGQDMRFPESTESDLYRFSITSQFPDSAILLEYDEIYLGVDFSITADDKIRIFADYEVLDAYGNVVEYYKTEDDYDPEWSYPIDETCKETSYYINMLPDEYYRNGGYRDPAHPSLWPLVEEDGNGDDVSVKKMLQVPDEIFDKIKDGTSTNIIRVNIYITSLGTGGTGLPFSCQLSIFEAGYIGYKSISPSKDDFYVRIKGETFEGAESNTVYKAYRLMLEGYDDIPSSNLDYTNLPYIRDAGWQIGRVITEQRSMYDYVKELAESSFVAMYFDREGRLCLRAWREPYLKWDSNLSEWVDQEPTPLSLPIIKDSIRSWSNTDIAKLYNDFYITFDLNPATDKYINFIYVTKVSEFEFPSTAGQTWKGFVGGVSDGSYADAKIWWDTCKESYTRSYALQPFPKDMQEQPWFTTSSIFNGLQNLKVSTEDAAYKFMDNCIRWLTRQKSEVTFSTPITTASVQTELVQTASFTDSIYTNGETRSGYVTRIEVDVKNNALNVTYLLEPEDVIIDNLIIERGIILNQDTHDEDGSQDDQVDDGQDRT